MCDNDRMHRITLMNPETFEEFSLTIVFEGPDGVRSTQQARTSIGKTLCSIEDLSSRGLDAADVRSSTLACLLRVNAESIAEAMTWPAILRRIVYFKDTPPVQRDIDKGGRHIGFFFIDGRRDNVLEYICIMSEVQSLGFGRLLYQHYELWLLSRMQYNQVKRIYLTAVDKIDKKTKRQRVIDFY